MPFYSTYNILPQLVLFPPSPFYPCPPLFLYFFFSLIITDLAPLSFLSHLLYPPTLTCLLTYLPLPLLIPLSLSLSLPTIARRILWEGIDVLTNQELREACQERGMQSVGLTQFGYKRQLQVRT